MQYWLTILTLLASLATIFALILSQDFLNFSRSIIASKWSRYGFLVLVTVAITYVALERPIWLKNVFFPPPQWPPSQGIVHDIHAKDRNLICGVNGYLEGFSLEREGTMSGLDADFCRAVAVAVLGNPQSVEFEKLTDEKRLTAVEEGEVDVLFRNTSWTIGRDLERKVDFGPTIFYDRQAVLVPKDSGIHDIQDLRGKKVCVLKATTSRDNLENYIELHDINPAPRIVTKRDGNKEFADNQDVFQTYGNRQNGICDAVTSDRSQVKIWKGDSDDHVILPELEVAWELLSPVFVEGDDNWANIVSNVVYATIHAMELGITKDNIDDLAKSGNLAIREFLGLTDDGGSDSFGEMLGIKRDFSYQVIKAVGNYSEIYERNLGDLIPNKENNALWKQGGMLVSPPFTLSKS